METLWARVRGGRAWIAAGAALLALILLIVLNRFGGTESAGKSALEQRLERILSEIYTGGRVSAMVAQEDGEAPSGAVIVAAGLEDIGLALELQRAARTLLGIEADRVSVIGAGVSL